MRASATREEIEAFKLRVGDVLITKDSEAWTDIGVPALVVTESPDLVCGYHLTMLRPISGMMMGAFLAYALRAPSVAIQLHLSAKGVTRYGLTQQGIKSALVPVPTMDEQELIVRYLDHAELRIAKAIAAKLELVRLLVEQRKVIESELIFGGGWKPNSDRWFGDPPKSWKVKAARALFTERVERDRSDLEMLSVTISRGVVQQSEYLKSAGSKKDQARQDRSQYKVVEMGDIVYNKMRAWQGAAGASRYQGIVSPAYVVVSPREGINSDYYGLVVRTPQFAREAERNSYGIVSDMWSLRPQHFKMIEFPSPPLAEQLEIVERCEATTRNLVGAIDSAEREVALLKEYRTRLISDVVTGKLDVRAEAAKLQVIDPEELAEVTAGAGLAAEDDGDDE